jgi:hypothetical protein
LRVLGFAFFFSAIVFCPWQFSRVSVKLQTTLSALTRAEPHDSAVVFHVHHASALLEVVAAEGTMSLFWHLVFNLV